MQSYLTQQSFQEYLSSLGDVECLKGSLCKAQGEEGIVYLDLFLCHQSPCPIQQLSRVTAVKAIPNLHIAVIVMERN